MKIRSSMYIVLSSMLFVGCDRVSSVSQPQSEARAMVIGGMPVYERDYRLNHHESALNEAVAKDEAFANDE